MSEIERAPHIRRQGRVVKRPKTASVQNSEAVVGRSAVQPADARPEFLVAQKRAHRGRERAHVPRLARNPWLQYRARRLSPEEQGRTVKRFLPPLTVMILSTSLAWPSGHGGHASGSCGLHGLGPGAHRCHGTGLARIPEPRCRLTRREKKALFERSGVPKGDWHHYVVNRKIPSELGGSDCLSNLQILDREAARTKRRLEKDLAARVRRGELGYSQARNQIAHWGMTNPDH